VLPDPKGLSYNATGNFGAGFLSATYQGTVINPSAPVPIPDLKPASGAKFATADASSEGLDLLGRMNKTYAADHLGDSRLNARIESYELAAKMQLAAPEVFDLTRETKEIHDRYGIGLPEPTAGFARNCLLTRRLLERGVRFVQVWSGNAGMGLNWDMHFNLPDQLAYAAKQVDRPIAALLHDLKTRGLFDDTLVIWTTEFGRTPFTQFNGNGRDHNSGTSVNWLAGAGIKGGVAYGESDEISYQAVKDKTTCYDLHATALHLMGIDHERLTVRHNGSNRRLTDVHGHVINAILS
jgi:uncharacterized protein (DUF1501 family)